MGNSATPKPKEVSLFGLVPPTQEAVPPYLQYSGERRLLTPPECRAIIETAESIGWHYGTIGNGSDAPGRDDPEYRSVEVCTINPTTMDPHGQDMRWLFAKLGQHAVWANQRYGFNLVGFCEGIQILKYTEPKDGRPAGHYLPHQDIGGGGSSLRKLSCVVQLSDPGDYDGCRLHLYGPRDFEVPHRGLGDLIIFPSYTPHYVTDLIKGVRYALAVWISGPRFV